MRLSVSLHRLAITDWPGVIKWAQEADRLGVHSMWTAEAWAHDAYTPIAYLMAKTENLKFGTGITQVGTRTPALVAMSSQSLWEMSGGRFILGLGSSGPQVIEGWHGIPFAKPLARTKELVEICRKIFNGEVLEYEGEFHHLPLTPEYGGSGEGKALKPGAPPTPDLPIYIASLGPKNLQLTGAIADGWLGGSFIPEHAAMFIDNIKAGAAKVGRDISHFDYAVGGSIHVTDDPERVAESFKPALAFSLGAMGSKAHNFYNDAYSRQGFADEAKEIQRLWLSGQRDAARAAVPTELVLATHLIGDRQQVVERLKIYQDAGVTTFRAGVPGESFGEKADHLAEIVELMNEVNA